MMNTKFRRAVYLKVSCDWEGGYIGLLNRNGMISFLKLVCGCTSAYYVII